MTPGCEIFFCNQQDKIGEVKVAFCPTHDMLWDFFTKPLQTTLFVHMRENKLNLLSSTFIAMHRKQIHERQI